MNGGKNVDVSDDLVQTFILTKQKDGESVLFVFYLHKIQ